VIKRGIVIDVYVIELRDRQVRSELPIHPAVKALVDAAVTADEKIISVLRIDPNRVVVDVLESFP